MDLEQIRTASPIEEVVGEKFKLKKKGAHLVGVEHDSLVVNPRTGWYHWNSQDEHGDVFDFVGRHLLNCRWNARDPECFMEAVRYLAQRAGIELPSGASLQNKAAWAERQLVLRLHDALMNDPAALAYVQHERGWNQAVLAAEKLGYVPRWSE